MINKTSMWWWINANYLGLTQKSGTQLYNIDIYNIY